MHYGTSLINPRILTDKDLYSNEMLELYKTTTKKTNNSLFGVGFLRIFITISEISAAIIAAKFGFPGPLVQIGIGLVGATAHTALSAANNSLTGIGIGIDYGTAFIPALTGAFRAMRIKSKIDAFDTTAISELLSNKEYIKSTKSLIRQTKSAKISLKKYQSVSKRISKIQARKAKYYKKGGLPKSDVNAKLLEFAKKYPEKAFKTPHGFYFPSSYYSKNIWECAMEIAFLQNRLPGLKKTVLQKYIAVMNKWKVSPKSVTAVFKEWENMFNSIRNIPFVKRMSKSQFIYEAMRLAPQSKRKLVKELYSDALLSKGAARTKKAVFQAKQNLKIAMNTMTKQGAEKLRLFVERFKAIKHSPKEVTEAVNVLVANLNEFDKQVLDELMTSKHTKDLFGHLTARTTFGNAFEKWTTRGVVKGLGSMRFNQYFVQLAQLIDPNDVGRFPIELLYQKLRRKWEKAIYKKSFEKAFQAGAKNIKKSRNLKEAFARSGGKLIKSKSGNTIGAQMFSRYIIGLKIMPGGTPLKRWVIVKFNKASTASATGKNVGGKKDILVTMNDADFSRLVDEGTAYWFSVGKKKGWFLSRGGRRITTRGTRILANDISYFLGFVPIPALRNVLSVVSNWIENVSDISQGNYFDNWWAKFTRAFTRSSMNRSARFVTKVVIGSAWKGRAAGIAAQRVHNQIEKASMISYKDYNKFYRQMISEVTAKATRSSAWVGRELQRASTTTLSAFQTTSSDGYFKLKSRSLKELGMRFARTAAPTSVRSSLIRSERQMGMSSRRGGRDYMPDYGRQLVNAKRYLGQVGRTYSAFTPNVAVDSLRKITRIRRK